MSNMYEILKNRHQEEYNRFPISFAFGKEQFKEAMQKLGLTEKDTDKIYPINGGGFIRISDLEDYKKLLYRQDKELQEAIAADKDGTGFIKDMFLYELKTHEYFYTYDLTDTLDSLNLKIEDIKKDSRLENGLRLAKESHISCFDNRRNKNDYER